MEESQNIEFKESWRDEYLRQICGLANTHGGTMYIGVDDNGKAVGVNNAKKLQEDIPNKVRDTLGILPDVLCRHEDGKDILEVVVQGNATPVSYKNKFYYRNGTVTSELVGSALHTFLLGKMGGQWDSEPVDGVTIDELDKESFDIFKSEAIRSGRLRRTDYPATWADLLDKLRLLREDGRLTRAAVLLFHRDPERWINCAFCKVAKFKGDSGILYHDEVHGSLMMQANRMLDLIYTKYLIPHIRFDGKQRLETYPYPKEAVREGLYNALMHNFYMNCVPIQIRINEKDMWISNDLAFNSKWTPENLMAPHRSEPYNALIANAFFWAGYVETWGRGIQEMCMECTDYGCPMPYYKEQPNGIMLVLPAHPDTISLQERQNDNVNDSVNDSVNDIVNVGVNVGVNAYNKLTKRQQAIIEMLSNDPALTAGNMSEVLSVSKSTIARDIFILQKNGMIIREGSDKKGRWLVCNQ